MEKETATHSSISAWEIAWTEEPGVLQSMGLQKVGHDLATIQQQSFMHYAFFFFFSDVFIYFNNPQVPHTARQEACHPMNNSRGKRSSITPHKTTQSCPTLCNPMDCSPPGSSVHAISQARILECVAMPSFRGSGGSQTRVQTQISCTAGGFFTF